MEIRCTDCGHLGAPADVQTTDDGPGLVCEQCGFVNVITTTSDDDAGDPTDDNSPQDMLGDADGTDGAIFSSESSTSSTLMASLGEMGTRRIFGKRETPTSPVLNVGDQFLEDSVQRLIPQPGEGRRCRKCFHLLDDHAMDNHPGHCQRCGLSIEEAAKYPDGQAPWEKPPPGKEEEQQHAGQLWERALDDDESKTIEDFVDYATQQGLVDFGMRTVQRHLVDHPDDQRARQALSKLASSLEVAVEVAKTRAESESEAFQEDVKEFRTRLLLWALVFWTAILLVFSWLFMDTV